MTIKTIRILLAAVDPPFAGMLKERLAATGVAPLEVLECPTPGDAPDCLGRSQRMDLVFLDLRQSGMDGLSAVAQVQQHSPSPSLVVLIAPGQEALGTMALDRGAQEYLLANECDLRMLGRTLRHALERRRLQDELRERREFSRLISQNATDLILILDKEGRRVYHSPSYKCILGDPDLVKGSTAFLEVHPEDRGQVQHALREALSTGTGQRLEYRFLLRDGGVRYVESQASVIKDRWGKPSKMVVVSRDTTERRQAEQALRESEQRYKRLLDSTTDYIFSVTVKDGAAAGTMHGPGCEALTGYTPEDFARSPQLWLGMVPPEDRPAVLAQARKLLQGETPAPIEHRLVRKNGQVRWIRNTSVPRRDPEGRLVAYDGLISDITERKEAEEKIRRAYAELAKNDEALRKTLEELNAAHEKLKATQLQLIQAEKFESIGTLAAGVAHEVKNPLQTILMGLAYLGNNLPTDHPNFPIVVRDMRDAVKRADTIVRELLALSASMEVTMKEEDFNAVVDRALFLVNYEVNAAKIHAVSGLAPHLPPVLIDRTRIEQVFLNLFLNAIQAMRQGGTLSVRTRAERWGASPLAAECASDQLQPGQPVVVAEVQDTGVGIPEPNLKRVFDPFFTTKPVGSGTGLGLSVARQIVDLHGGVIDVRNVPEGGVRATIVLRSQEPDVS
jgi:PAS domain S-box-containing protein